MWVAARGGGKSGGANVAVCGRETGGGRLRLGCECGGCEGYARGAGARMAGARAVGSKRAVPAERGALATRGKAARAVEARTALAWAMWLGCPHTAYGAAARAGQRWAGDAPRGGGIVLGRAVGGVAALVAATADPCLVDHTRAGH